MDILWKNLLVLASAGSGKTYCLSDRIIGLAAKGVEPEKIVALTFTRKAAGEFADAILKKLAEAASDGKKSRELAEKFGSGTVDFEALLEKVVKSLPKLTLGTMDGFFARVVKGFQYELGVAGGKFDLLEGELAEAAREELMEKLLDGGLEAAAEEDFIHTFRRATGNKEGTMVLEDLKTFISTWHSVFVSPQPQKPAWGPAELVSVDVADWEKRKKALIDLVSRDWPNVVMTDKRQQKAFEELLVNFEKHTIGSGLLGKAGGLAPKVLEAAAKDDGPLEVTYYKPLTITGMAAQALRDLVELAAQCEFAAALSRTRGIYHVIAAYDRLMDRELRSRGRLGFDDVKRLMSAWIISEDNRLRREAVDFRLDANYQHWLLDEFQDTSQDEWNGLLPLIDEALSDDDASVFVVGDKKQAIYAWRGGKVELFDELVNTYGSGLQVETMTESWRSCPEVLDLVNRICGASGTLSGLFGDDAQAWNDGWKDHVSAEPLTRPAYAGHARIEVTQKDEIIDQVIARLKQIGIGNKALSCGILVSKNDDVRAWADVLRAEGFQVVEEGAREPGKDHPVGVMIWQLLRWLANPADSFAKHTVMMSPLGAVLNGRYGNDWKQAWNGLGKRISEIGFSETVRECLAPLSASWQAFGARRLEDLLQALKELDDQGVVSVREAAGRVERMKISQSPGVAAIQVMTIHKSKGLGFDVVFLPGISHDKIPSLTHFNTILTEKWISAAPASWVRKCIPELEAAERKWVRQQTYEAFCKLYVALTRAKRGLYVFLEEPSASSGKNKASLGQWITDSLNMESEAGAVVETGSENWHHETALLDLDPLAPISSLSAGVAKRARTAPSGDKNFTSGNGIGDGSARRHGIAVHRAFESVGWIDEEDLPEVSKDIREPLTATFSSPEIRELFSRKGRTIRLYREQRIEAVLDEKWMSGVIDRLHLHLDESGSVNVAEIIDFKTDRVGSANELKERYESQMKSYCAAVSRMYPDAEIRCVMVSTVLKQVVR